MTQRLLIVDSALDRSVYCPVEQWAKYLDGVLFDAIHLPSGESLPLLDPYTHILLTGSEASFSQPQSWFDIEADLVRDAVDRGLAVLGSCFGHQMLAWALSGPTTVRQAPTPELGWVAIDILADDVLVAELPRSWHTFASHQDEVVSPPPPWHILASNAACAVQAMRYGDLRVWGIQPHPEISPKEAMAQMKAGLKKHPEYAQQIQQAMASPVRDDGATPALVAAFLRS